MLLFFKDYSKWKAWVHGLFIINTLRKKFLKNYYTSSKATTDCKNPKNYHTLQ